MLTTALKIQTASAHESLENSSLMMPLHRGEVTAAYYQQLLIKFYGIFMPLEESVKLHQQALASFLPDIDQRRKATALTKDLAFMNTDTSDIALHNFKEINSPAAALGAMYVMEGSTLGGRFIAKTIQKHLNIDPEEGITFFSGYGQDTGTKWKLFQEGLLNFEANNSEAVPEVIAAANYVFKEFDLWID